MNPREPWTSEEQALAAHLQEWSTGGPSANLDAAVLAQARTAVAVTPRLRRPWLVSVASAAALVLTVGVVWRTLQSPQNEVLAPPPAPVMSAPAPASTEIQALNRAKIEAKASSGSASESREQAGTVAGEATVPMRAAREEAVDRAESATPPTADDALFAPPPEPAPIPSAPPAEPFVAPPPPEERSPPSAEAELQQPVPERIASPEPSRDAAVETASRRERRQSAPVTAQSRSAAADQSTGAPAQVPFEQAVDNIRVMLREGEVRAARTAIMDLRRRFPDQALPADLVRIERLQEPDDE